MSTSNIVGGHTPGPWEVGYSDEGGSLIEATDGYVAKACYWSRPEKEQKANARLVAAAPELLEALRELERVYETGDFDSEFKPALEKARAAIARAEGRS